MEHSNYDMQLMLNDMCTTENQIPNNQASSGLMMGYPSHGNLHPGSENPDQFISSPITHPDFQTLSMDGQSDPYDLTTLPGLSPGALLDSIEEAHVSDGKYFHNVPNGSNQNWVASSSVPPPDNQIQEGLFWETFELNTIPESDAPFCGGVSNEPSDRINQVSVDLPEASEISQRLDEYINSVMENLSPITINQHMDALGVNIVNQRTDGVTRQESRKRNAGVITLDENDHLVTEVPRVILRTPSDEEIIDDGYKWRKYGQKLLKDNPNHRNYYKCTTIGCLVKKKIERDPHDRALVVTTYEGRHNHERPTPRGYLDLYRINPPNRVDSSLRPRSNPTQLGGTRPRIITKAQVL